MVAVLSFLQIAMSCAAAMVVIMLAAWAYQRRKGNAGWIDVFWTFGTGAVLVCAVLVPAPETNPTRQALVAALTGIWSLRLGLYVARRVAESPEDARYVELRRQWGTAFQARLLRFIMLQPVVSAILALSALAAARNGQLFGWRDFAGLGVLVVAIVGETLADAQMRRYRKTRDRAPVMDRGLWGLSRHPNYFFEWLTWTAFPILGLWPSQPVSWFTLLAPAVMYLVLRHGTGVPMLEASMLARKGEAFRAYQERVNVFFPSLRKPA